MDTLKTADNTAEALRSGSLHWEHVRDWLASRPQLTTVKGDIMTPITSLSDACDSLERIAAWIIS